MQHLFRPRADDEAWGQVDPPHGATSIDQELTRPSDVGVPRSRAGVQEVVAADDLGVHVGQQWEGQALPGAMDFEHLWRIVADGDNADPASVEVGYSLLETPQLGVAKRSPVAAIEDQEHAARF